MMLVRESNDTQREREREKRSKIMVPRRDKRRGKRRYGEMVGTERKRKTGGDRAANAQRNIAIDGRRC